MPIENEANSDTGEDDISPLADLFDDTPLPELVQLLNRLKNEWHYYNVSGTDIDCDNDEESQILRASAILNHIKDIRLNLITQDNVSDD